MNGVLYFPPPAIPLDVRKVDETAYEGDHRKFAKALAEYGKNRGKYVAVPDLNDLIKRCDESINNNRRFRHCIYYAQFFNLKREFEENEEGEIMDTAFLNEAEAVFKRKGVFLKTDANGTYFSINEWQPVSGTYTKIYGCIKTERGLEFAESLDDEKLKKAQLKGKFYTGADSACDRNKLCLYVKHESLADVLDFLDERQDMFYRVKNNHPAGVHPFPGVSAVMVVPESRISFDEAVRDTFDDVYDPKCKDELNNPDYAKANISIKKRNVRIRRIIEGEKTKPIAQVLKEELILNPNVGAHFAFLDKYGGSQLLP